MSTIPEPGMRNDVASRFAVLHGDPQPIAWARHLCPYEPVSSLARIWEHPEQSPLKLDWNESTVPPAPGVYEAIVRFLSHSNHLNWYPELASKSLTEALGRYVDLPPANILVTNGSDDALELVCKTYLGPGDRVLVPMPTYTHFLVYLEARGAKVVDYYSSDMYSNDVEGIDRALGHNTKLVYLVSPNNPTGVTYNSDEVRFLLDRHPNTLFVVDEAYFEFHGVSVVGLVREYKNLVVTRTFSKCFGIAGLRMGYLCAHDTVMHELHKLFNPKSVNRVGQIAAQACLDDLDYYKRLVEQVDEAKQMLAIELPKRGLDVHMTPANFMLVRLPDPKRFCAELETEGVYIRDRSTLPRMEGYVRVTVPTVAQVPDLLQRIDAVMARL